MRLARPLQGVLVVFSVVLTVVMLLLLVLKGSSTVAYARGSGSTSVETSALATQPFQSAPLLTGTGAYSSFLPLAFRFYPPPISFFDTFDDPACNGWSIHYFDRYEPDPPGPWVAYCDREKLSATTYGNNRVYSIKTTAAWNSWIYTAPVVLADPKNFTITVDGKSAQNYMWLSSWGVYFNANADRTQFYSVQIYQDGVPDLDTSPDYMVRRWIHFTGGAKDPNYELQHKKRCHLCQNGDFGWNRIIIRRVGDTVYVYAGDAFYPPAFNAPVAVFNMPEYTGSDYIGVGVFQGNFEWMNWDGNVPTFQIDNFYAWPVYKVR